MSRGTRELELKPYNRSGDPENHSWLRKQITPGKITVGLAVLSACGVIGSKIYSNLYGDERKTLDAIEDVMHAPEENETVDESEILPEDERSGNNILIAAHPTGHFAQYRKEGAYRQYFEENFKAMLDVLPTGTNVHVVVPENSREEALKVVAELFPKLNFVIYGLPYTLSGVLFAQDTFCATGGFDKKGRPMLATSTIDDDWLEKGVIEMGKVRSKFAYAIPFHEDNERADYGIMSFGDDLLAKTYSDKFSAKKVPVRTEGGDLHFSRMSDGRLALVVGRKNLVETIMFGLKETEGDIERQANGVGIGYIIPYVEKVRDLYKKAFKVDEVIFLGENVYRSLAGEEFRNRWEMENEFGQYRDYLHFDEMMDRASMIPATDPFFFHEDMVLKTVTTPDGRHVALCTDYSEERAIEYLDILAPKTETDDIGYDLTINNQREHYKKSLDIELMILSRIQAQFSNLGYEVVKLPCGVYPTQNYANSVVFKGEGKEKIAIVPQYGIPEDKQALEIYKSLGFKVLAVDYTDSINATTAATESSINRILVELGTGDSGGIERGGSLHCRTVVLGDSKRDAYKASPKVDDLDPIPYVKPVNRTKPPKYLVPKGEKGSTHKPIPNKGFNGRHR